MTTRSFESPRSVLVGDTADIFLHRALTILRNEGINPDVAMEFTCDRDGVIAGISEVRSLLSQVLPETGRELWALDEGVRVSKGEVCLRIRAPYAAFGLYETAVTGTLGTCSGWATGARECVDAAGDIPVMAAGAKHVHPLVAGIYDYSAFIGGCQACSTVLGGNLTGLTPAGSMAHPMVMLVGDTVRAVTAFDRHMPPEVPRVALVDTFKDEGEESLAVARQMRDRLRGVAMETPPERGGVTPALVREVRSRLDQSGFRHVDIYVSGELNPERIRQFVEEQAPVSVFVVGDYIASSPPVCFTADIKEIDGMPVARRGRIPGITENLRLTRVL